MKWNVLMRPGLYDWPPQYAGDTADALSFTIQRNSVAVDLTDASIKMQVRACAGQLPILDLSTTDGTSIVITDAINGIFRVGYHPVPTMAGAYQYDVQVTFPTGDVKTYFKGSYVIEGEVTL